MGYAEYKANTCTLISGLQGHIRILTKYSILQNNVIYNNNQMSKILNIIYQFSKHKLTC